MTNTPSQTPPVETLSEEQLREIEALSAKVPNGPWFASSDDADDVPGHRRSGLALVDTGRSADWWIARLCEWHTARFIAESKTSIDALCRTLRVAWAERNSVTDELEVADDALERQVTLIADLRSENAALREQLARCEGSRRVHELDNHHNALACSYCSGPLKDELLRLQAITEKL